MYSHVSFARDNFSLRRSGTIGSGVSYDPESLISGAESKAGFTYLNSHRNFFNSRVYQGAVEGKLTTEQILNIAPRILNSGTFNPVDEINRGALPDREDLAEFALAHSVHIYTKESRSDLLDAMSRRGITMQLLKKWQLGVRRPNRTERCHDFTTPYIDLPVEELTEDAAYAKQRALQALSSNVEWRLVEVIG